MRGKKKGQKADEQLSKAAKVVLRIINRFAMQDMARKLLGPGARVSACLRYQAFGHEGVQCIHVPKRMGARLGGLQTCGSVWACPICSAKVTERRRVELRRAVDVWRASGGSVALLTYTFSHHLGDDLAALQEGMMSARSRAMSGAPYQRVKRLGLVGSVRAVELTYGANGWHLHIHELVFLEAGADVVGLETGFKGLWLKGLTAAGLSASEEHGFDWSDAGAEVEDYIAKWGHEPTAPLWDCAAELTKQPAKLGRQKGRTPFQLLADCLALEGAEADGAGRLFTEYAGVMHGKRQLVWSRWDTGEKTEKGRPKTVSFLTHLLGVEELSDDDLAAQSDDDGVTLAHLVYPAWRLIVADGRRAELWNLLRAGDADGVAAFIAPYVAQVQGANCSGRVVSTPRPRLVAPTADERDRLLPVGYDLARPWDELADDLGPNAGDLAERLYRRHVAGDAVHWFTERAAAREQVREEVRSLLAPPTAPVAPAPSLFGDAAEEVETEARPIGLAPAPPPARPYSRSEADGRTEARKGGDERAS